MTGQSLVRRVREALARPGALVVLGGPPGVGKSQLARAVIREMGAPAEWVYGERFGRTIPFGALALTARIESSPLPREIAAAWRATWGLEADVIIVVNNAQWLDAASVEVLRRLADEPAPPRLLLAMSIGEAPSAELSGLLQDPAVTTVTAGNPLHSGDSTWSQDGRIALSPELCELTRLQIRHADLAVSRLLAFLAMHEPLELELLEVLGCLGAVRLARHRQLVQCGSAGQAWLLHPMIGDVVRASTGLLGARAIRAEMVAAMGTLARLSQRQRITRAELAIDAEAKLSVAEVTAAAEYALLLSHHSLAEKLARNARARGGGFPALSAHAAALSRLGRAAEAEAILAAIDPDGLPEFALAAWLMDRMVNLFFAAADSEGALGVYWRHRDRITVPLLALPLDNFAAGIGLCLGDVERGLRIALDSLESPFTSPDSDAAARWVCSAALSLTGKVDQLALAVPRGGSPVSASAAALRPHSTHFAIEGLLLCGYLPEAEARAEALAAASEDEHVTAAVAGLSVARVQAARGDLLAAESGLRAVLRNLNPRDKEGWRFRALIELASVGALLGKLEPELVVGAEELCGNQVVLRPGLELARARVAAAQGQVRQARALALRAAAYSATHGLWSFEARSLHLATQLSASGSGARLTELERTIDGPLIGVICAHARAFDASDPVGLACAADRFDHLGYLVESADALAQAVTAHETAGQGLDAGRLRGRLAALSAECDDLRTTAIDAAMRSLSLTAREREVAALISHGASNREIAARLGLSVRTVEGHIMRACEKLAVSGREGLRGVANAN